MDIFMSKSGNANQPSIACPWALNFLITLFLLTLAACPVMAGKVDNVDYLHYTSVPGKSLVVIKGTSTLHDWSAKSEEVRGSVELIDDHEIGSRPEDKDHSSVAAENVRLVFSIPVRSLKSEFHVFDEAMYKIMDCAKPSVITFKLVHATQIAPPESYNRAFKIKGVLQLHCVKRPISLVAKVKRPSARRLLIETETKVKLTDFKITPPALIDGLLAAGDEVKIKLSWVLAASQ
jgi:polyisoprenoid-binding protein YceI